MSIWQPVAAKEASINNPLQKVAVLSRNFRDESFTTRLLAEGHSHATIPITGVHNRYRRLDR
jgi:hypothetical protein